ncbi:MAG: PQQ-dependent sugar dehydrogenase [Actinobacteria bacterium]|nr:PQQ-dependent sugar dehydrogenase [Actinomycetota bacterium]
MSSRLLAGLATVLLVGSCGAGSGGSDSAGSSERGLDTAAQAPSPPPLDSGPPALERVGDFSQPTYLTSPPDDARVFVVEKGGRIVEMVDGQARTPAFLDISGEVSTGSEQGLLSVAFAPDFADSGLLYINYTDPSGATQIEEWQVDPGDADRAEPESRRTLLTIDQPYSNHNGGLIRFDPDGMLVIGMGDGGSRGDPENRAQDLQSLLGKMLRIDPGSPSDGRPYGIPDDNPFVDSGDARPEIWAYGLRNPWRWSFDGDDFYVADVGQNRVEEVNYVEPGNQAGANYGWSRYEGNEVYDSSLEIDESNLVSPILTYPNDSGNCSVTGGGVYRGPVKSLSGYYLYGDFCGGVVKGFRVANGRAVDIRTFEDMQVESLSSFGLDSAGDMYVLSLSGGVFKITS